MLLMGAAWTGCVGLGGPAFNFEITNRGTSEGNYFLWVQTSSGEKTDTRYVDVLLGLTVRQQMPAPATTFKFNVDGWTIAENRDFHRGITDISPRYDIDLGRCSGKALFVQKVFLEYLSDGNHVDSEQSCE